MMKWFSVRVRVIAILIFAGFIPCLSWAGGNEIALVSALPGGWCMDASLDHVIAEGRPVYLFKCLGVANQHFTVSASVNEQAVIIGYGGQCLDVRPASKDSKEPVAPKLYSCHFGPNQRFSIEKTGEIKDVATGLCLQVKEAKIRGPIILAKCQGAQGEQWVLKQ